MIQTSEISQSPVLTIEEMTRLIKENGVCKILQVMADSCFLQSYDLSDPEDREEKRAWTQMAILLNSTASIGQRTPGCDN